MTTRRDFLITAASLVLAPLALAREYKKKISTKPNILFLCLDDVGRTGLEFYPQWQSSIIPAASLNTPHMKAFADDPPPHVYLIACAQRQFVGLHA